MEKHEDFSSLSLRTEVSDWLMYHVCVIMLVLLNYLQFVTGFSFLKILLFYILSTFRNNLSNNTTQNRLLITSVKIDIFTKSLEVTVHNF